MSFTQNIKEDISKIRNQCKFCDVAELSAIVKLCANYQGGEIFIVTETDAVAERLQLLFGRVFGKKLDYTNKNGSFRFCPELEFFVSEVTDRLALFGEAYEQLIPNECCGMAYIRGAFLGGGSISDPNSRYHLEFDARYEVYANQINEILAKFGINSKITYRKGRFIVYIKDYEQIADVLGIMGDVTAVMDFYNVTAEKNMRNIRNRRANCEAANIDKIAKTVAEQRVAIQKIQKTIGVSQLPAPLQEIIRLRIENPFDSLKELGEKANPPIGKSGVNHRLKRIAEIAEKL